MEANELRIGNYVNTSERSGRSYQICRQGLIKTINNSSCNIIAYNGLSHIVTVDFKNIEPIPLTEEWLIKFGFENDNSFLNAGFTSFIKDKIIIEQDVIGHYSGYWSFRIAMDSENSCHVNLIKYVHSLQNLFFAITGEELCFKA